MPYWSSNQFYAIPASCAIGDTFDAIKGDGKIRLTITSFRKVGSFNGQGYFAYLLESDDGEQFAGVGETK